MKHIKISYLLIILSLGCSLNLWSSVNLVELTPQQIISYAETAIGSKYVLGYSHWDPKNKSWGGVDCGGLVQKAWRWPKALPYKERMKGSYTINGQKVPGKLFTGSMLEVKKHKLPWTMSSDLKQAKIGDSFTFYNGGKIGHTLLVAGMSSNGKVKSLEARSKKLGVGYFERTTAELKGKKYKLLRRQRVSHQTKLKTTERKTSSASPTRHTVVAGDTVWGLSRKYGVSVGHILKLNSGLAKNPSLIKVGESLRVR